MQLAGEGTRDLAGMQHWGLSWCLHLLAQHRVKWQSMLKPSSC
jgi:hypothetical protein